MPNYLLAAVGICGTMGANGRETYHYRNGSCRVHGGGFAGTVQAIVPSEHTVPFKSYMEKVFGKDSCLVLRIRPDGAIEVR